jgi:hypothetical protein
MSRWLFLPDSVVGSLEVLAQLSPVQIDKLREFLGAPQSASRYAEYVKVGEELSIPDQEAANLFSFCEYVQEERKENDKGGPDTVAEFLAFLKAKARAKRAHEKRRLGQIEKRIQERRSPLAALFNDFPKRDHVKKVSSSRSLGPGKQIISIRAAAELLQLIAPTKKRSKVQFSQLPKKR